eukprot:NODE_239_length_1602_cov_252.748229_g170_i0.p2 GENE.NODE_239_length_1602_cov_252.748229_g170_i0~~NODE_239_length_1602_cov_252.748229_g170_i0.p2  ORF type:complete len:209 (+),score=50.35 NODE_239_length_1602_cov_252.748229_g170_i0:524-1150(+)
MTVSFHKFGDFFPGTGNLMDVGAVDGRHYAVNVPLRDGITDEAYLGLFRPIMTRVLEAFQPSAIVQQSGADSLAGDRLGTFNLGLKGHSECVRFLKQTNIPLLVLGGGGYTLRNVARCWAYETAVLLDVTLPTELPDDPFTSSIFQEERTLCPPSPAGGAGDDLNPAHELERIRETVFEHLRRLQGPPSVQLQDTPRPLASPLSPGSS